MVDDKNLYSIPRGGGRYEYFRGMSGVGPKPRRSAGVASLSDALPLLPAGAKRIGSGMVARGTVCSSGSALGDITLVDFSPLLMLGTLILVPLFLWGRK